MAKLQEIKNGFLSAIDSAKTSEELESVRIKFLGRKSELTAVLRSLKDLPLVERRRAGPEAQALRREMETLLSNRLASHQSSVISHQSIDFSAPAKKIERGHLHPLTIVDEEIRKIFSAMNFSVVDGPEVETEYYNFDALNIPPDHPARDIWDTFFLKSKIKNQKSKLLLRTHTSPVQIRYMEEHNPPFQIIVPGRVFRYEATDASHEVNFCQLEGLMVGKEVNLANFKFIVEEFFKRFFKGQKIQFRYRPSYFPFVEPGLEVDIRIADQRGLHAEKRGKGLRKSASSQRQSAWLEVMGAGMVHPHVFEYAHYNPRDSQGFAFGMGIDRLAMIKYKIPDIRMFYSGDLRLVKQF